MKKHLSTIIVIVVFLCGLSLFLYPTVSNLYNEYINQKLIGNYQEQFEKVEPQAYADAKANATLYNEHLHDKAALSALGLNYEELLNLTENGIMGYIEIPKISVSLVIYHTVEENYLQNGIGHLPDTALPIGGESTHCVLAGHTGLPSAKLLTNIDHLKLGDSFYLHVLDETLHYRIDSIRVVEPHETEYLNVENGKDYVTLVTCTPYGVNSHRLLVRGTRVKDGENIPNDTTHVPSDLVHVRPRYLVTFSLIGLGILLLLTVGLITHRRNRQIRKRRTHDQTSQNHN